MRIVKKIVLVLVIFFAGVLGVRQVLVIYPAFLFAWQGQGGNLRIYADEPFADSAGMDVLALVRKQLVACPFYVESKSYRIFVCNRSWRRDLLFFPLRDARALYYPCVRNAFLCGGVIEDNRLRLPNGNAVTDERLLSYFATHEIVHSLSNDTIGLWKYMFLPDWIKEGYADYVARGSVLNRPGMRESFLEDSPEMNWPTKAPYVRYNILVAYCLETLGMTPVELHHCGISQKDIEAKVRADFTR